MGSGTNKKLALAAMICAVAMTFIDQTIVAIAVPDLQKDLGLIEAGVQWVINGYLVALAALFAFGGRIADIAGHRRMVLIGISIFAVASALCGATPDGAIAEPWLILWRVVQGAGAAIMFPAALAIVVAAYPRESLFKEDIIRAFYDGIRHKPDTTFGNVKADVLADKDPQFRRGNFCSVIRASRWRG